MEIKNFFRLSSKLLASTFQVRPIASTHKGSNASIDGYKLICANYEGITFPIVFKHESGNKLTDMLDTGWAGLYLISDKMKNILSENNFTGWKTFPVEIIDKNENIIFGYSGLSITGRCGSIDYSQCETIEKRLAPLAPVTKYYKGLYVGLDKWDNSDFFLPEKYYGTIMTERAAEIIRKNKLANVELKNLADIEIPDFALKK